jgi:hypothetical protein
MCDQFAHCVVLSCPVGSAYEMDCLKVMHRFDLLGTSCDSLDICLQRKQRNPLMRLKLSGLRRTMLHERTSMTMPAAAAASHRRPRNLRKL